MDTFLRYNMVVRLTEGIHPDVGKNVTYSKNVRHIIIRWEEVSMMQQKKQADYQRVISIEEYLMKRKRIKEQDRRKNVLNLERLPYQDRLCLEQGLF